MLERGNDDLIRLEAREQPTRFGVDAEHFRWNHADATAHAFGSVALATRRIQQANAIEVTKGQEIRQQLPVERRATHRRLAKRHALAHGRAVR